jgi:hippurate hydrolase
VYGFHNVPNFTEGDIRVIEGGGAVMSASTIIKITVTGRGGHGSVPHKIEDVITAANAVF